HGRWQQTANRSGIRFRNGPVDQPDQNGERNEPRHENIKGRLGQRGEGTAQKSGQRSTPAARKNDFSRQPFDHQASLGASVVVSASIGWSPGLADTTARCWRRRSAAESGTMRTFFTRRGSTSSTWNS